MGNSVKEEKIVGELIDSFPYPAVIVDEDGVITKTNESWQSLASEDNLLLSQCGPGVNYIEVAQNATDFQEEKAKTAAKGIKSVISGEKEIYTQSYTCCTSPDKKWFEMKVKPFKQGALIVHEEVTGHKQREKEYESLYKEYKIILENTQSSIFLLNVEDEEKITFQRLNKTEERLTGVSTAEVKGKTPEEAFAGELGQELKSNYRECLEKRETITYEEKLELPAGQKTWLTRLIPVIVDGRVEKIVGSSLDITEMKEDKQWSDVLFEDSTSAIALLDEKGNVKNVNKKFRKTFGYKLSEIKNENLDEILNKGKSGSADRKKTQKVLQGEKSKFEGRRFDREGNLREFLIKGIPVKIDGEIRGVYAIYDDITEFKKQQQKLEAIFAASKNVAFIITEPASESQNIQARIKEFSPGAENIFGYERKEVMNEPVSILHSQETEDEIIDMQKKVYGGESWTGKLKLRRKNGKKFVAMLNIYPLESLTGKNKALGVVIDINELEKTREKLEYLSYHDELTGLYNRKFMEENMERLDVERQMPISIIMLDVNGLKIINDTFGHEMGDKLLIKAAEILEDNIRQEDMLSRWAGDEFVILLPQTKISEAKKIIERIKEKCQQTYSRECRENLAEEPPVSMGIGAASKTETDQDLEEILNIADKRMYQDKRKNGFTAKREMLNCLLHRLYNESFESEEHNLRVTNLAIKLGEKVGLSESELNDLTRLVNLHDIGKLTIDEEILKKTEELNEKEWEEIKQHSNRGSKAVAPVENLSHLSNVLEAHHENWAGGGYPEGKSGSNIPLLARIFAICDAYDVMTTGRPYKESMSKEEALKEIEECAGSQFDPELAEEFVEMMKDEEDE